MKEIIDVQIGEVKAGKGSVLLRSKAIGSCIAIVAYDSTKNIGALAHVMLPGSAPRDKKTGEKTKYAADAVEAIITQMTSLGSENDDIEVVLVGGANVLRREDETICRDNIRSTVGLLRKRRLMIRAHSVGGTSRRSVSLDLEEGAVYYSKGDGGDIQLWRA